MHAAVVEFDALSDAVGATAQYHDFLAVADRHPVRCIIGGVVIGGGVHPADRHRLPGLHDALPLTLGSNRAFRPIQQTGQIAVGKAVFFGTRQQFIGQIRAAIAPNLLFQHHEFLHLFDKPGLDPCQVVERPDIGPLAKRFIHLKLALAVGRADHLEQIFQGLFVKILGKTEPIAAVFQTANGLLKRLLVVASEAHDLAHGLHLGAQFISDALKFFEGPAREFHHDIVPGGGVSVEGAIPPVRDFIQGKAAGQQGGYPGDGKPRGLGRQGRRARGPRVDFDHHHPAGDRVVGELDIGAADHLDGLDDSV